MNADDISFRDYVDRRFDDLLRTIDLTRAADKEAVKVALDAAKEAVGVALTAQKEWREAANEWRGAMSDRERTFVQKGELENLKAIVGSLSVKLESQTERTAGQSTGRREIIGWIVGAASFLAAVVAVVGFLIAR